MIEINLLPDELKSKIKVKNPEQKAVVISGIAFKPEQLFIYALPALLGLFIVIHLYLGIISISKNSRLVYLNKKWMDLAPQKKILDDFNQDYSSLTQDATANQLLSAQKVFWAQKLNELSLELPGGVWFSEIIVDSKNLTIRGSVISLQKDEVALINKLLDNLKADNEFSKDFTGFELSNVQKESIGGYDIADFVLSGALKTK